jgi:hypothetical protein
MKNIAILICLVTLLIYSGCKKPCAGIVTYTQLDSRIPNYFYKVGSYWVYRDSADGITDSQYVYSYIYRQHYRNPLDTPEPLYNQTSVGSTSNVYCGPYYLDEIAMHLASFQNGILNDTLNFYALGSANTNNDCIIYEHDTATNQSSAIDLVLDWSSVGLLKFSLSQLSSGTSSYTTCTWYEGTLASISSGAYTFNNVNIWRIQIQDGLPSRFIYPTDLYILSGYGIIKMVQHLPNRDVEWNLINYHIVN